MHAVETAYINSEVLILAVASGIDHIDGGKQLTTSVARTNFHYSTICRGAITQLHLRNTGEIDAAEAKMIADIEITH